MNTLEIIKVSYNHFGDTVFSFMDEDYPFYQFNCSSGKQLIQDIKEFNSPVLICYTDESNGSVIVNFRPALPVLEEMLSIHNSVDNDHIDSRGAEIASMYGY